MGRNESTPDLRDQRYAEVAAIQNSLAHMSMPHHSDLGAYGHSTPPPNRGQRSPLLSPSGVPLRTGPFALRRPTSAPKRMLGPYAVSTCVLTASGDPLSTEDLMDHAVSHRHAICAALHVIA